MIEIVFSDSACGSLKIAQHYGEGQYNSGCTGVIVSKQDGSEPTPAEISKAQQEAQERERLEWENAIPMGGNPKDVFGFNLMLSVGDISADDFIGGRKRTIESLWSIYPNDPSDEPFDIAQEISKGIEAIRNRITKDDEIRIWYSNQPDELCGLYWLMGELENFPQKPKSVYIVKLPEHEYKENNTIVTHQAWGEISPEDWHKYISYAEATTEVFCKYCSSKWKALQRENAPLRAVLNGNLHSVSDSIYDEFIYREINNQADEFQEAMLIGTIMGKYQLGIGDAWIANRIEKIIDNGELFVESQPTRGMPIYHRKLRKSK